MPLSGTLDTMQLSDLLQWVQSTVRSGTLTVTSDMVETVLVFSGGDLVAMHSGGSLQRDVGQELLASGLISEDQLFEAVQATQQGVCLTEVLIDHGIVDDDAITKAHAERALDRVLDLFFQEEGSFHFADEGSTESLLAPPELPKTSHFETPLQTRSVLFEGMRRLDEWNRIRAVFTSDYTVVRALDGQPSRNPAWRLLREVDQPMSCGELCLRLGGSHFEVYQALYRAYQLGLVAPEAAEDEKLRDDGAGPGVMLVQNAQVLLEERQYNEAAELLMMAANVSPDNREVRTLLTEVRKAHLETLYQEIPPHLTPVRTVELDALGELQLNHRELYLVSRLNGRWDVATLVVATPFGELETLRILSKFLHAGIARLESEEPARPA